MSFIKKTTKIYHSVLAVLVSVGDRLVDTYATSLSIPSESFSMNQLQVPSGMHLLVVTWVQKGLSTEGVHHCSRGSSVPGSLSHGYLSIEKDPPSEVSCK